MTGWQQSTDASMEILEERIDTLGWTDTTDGEAFNYAVHQTMQALRATLRALRNEQRRASERVER